jgi:hypothetical protein
MELGKFSNCADPDFLHGFLCVLNFAAKKMNSQWKKKRRKPPVDDKKSFFVPILQKPLYEQLIV